MNCGSLFCRLSLLSCPFLLHPTRKSILSQNALIATPDIQGINSGTSKMQRNLLKTKISCFRRTKKKHGCGEKKTSVLCGANLLLAKSSKAAALSLFLLGILWHYALKVVGNVFCGQGTQAGAQFAFNLFNVFSPH